MSEKFHLTPGHPGVCESETVTSSAAGFGGITNDEVEIPNLAALRLEQNYADGLQIRKLETEIYVGKPKPNWFFRVQTDPKHSAAVLLHKGEEIGEFFLLNPKANYGVLGFGRPYALHTAINREGRIFLLPVGMPDATGRLDQTTQSLARAVEEAKSRWTRVTWSATSRAYEVSVAEGELDGPAWPAGTLDQRIRTAFVSNFIADREHPLVRRLRGCK